MTIPSTAQPGTKRPLRLQQTPRAGRRARLPLSILPSPTSMRSCEPFAQASTSLCCRRARTRSGRSPKLLRGRDNLDAVHIVAHGENGEVCFSSAPLTLDTIDAHAAELKAVGEALDRHGALLLWSCGTGGASAAALSSEALTQAIGAEVAAARGPVGCSARGGSWDLEVRSGRNSPQAPLSARGMASYAGVLVNDSATAGNDIITQTTGDDTLTVTATAQVGANDFFDGDAGTDTIVLGVAGAGTSIDLSKAGTDATHGFHNYEGITFANTSGTGTATFNAASVRQRSDLELGDDHRQHRHASDRHQQRLELLGCGLDLRQLDERHRHHHHQRHGQRRHPHRQQPGRHDQRRRRRRHDQRVRRGRHGRRWGWCLDTIALTATSADLNSATNARIVNVEVVSAASAGSGVTINLSAQTEGFTITGSGSGDTITGGSNNDTIAGGGGNDTINGFVGADRVDGGAGTRHDRSHGDLGRPELRCGYPYHHHRGGVGGDRRGRRRYRSEQPNRRLLDHREQFRRHTLRRIGRRHDRRVRRGRYGRRWRRQRHHRAHWTHPRR